MKVTSRRMSGLAACALTGALIIPVIAAPLARAAGEGSEVTVGVNVSNKMDVALAVGRTEVKYANFEADLRARLEHPEDFYPVDGNGHTKFYPPVLPE
ncbi:MAG: hypothetical protein LBB54_03215, partial [Cellulomonadaceae bacterium]|nr:hypothetical protein [Cellulomonadaceae bacterium]